jgi:hypothetical protein
MYKPTETREKKTKRVTQQNTVKQPYKIKKPKLEYNIEPKKIVK